MQGQDDILGDWQGLYRSHGADGPEGLLLSDPGKAGAIIHSVARLSFEPYWERVWVVQELALAPSQSLFFYGNARLSMYEMYELIRFAGQHGNWDGHYAAGEEMQTSYSVKSFGWLRRASELVTRAILPLVSTANSQEGHLDPLSTIRACSSSLLADRLLIFVIRPTPSGPCCLIACQHAFFLIIESARRWHEAGFQRRLSRIRGS